MRGEAFTNQEPVNAVCTIFSVFMEIMNLLISKSIIDMVSFSNCDSFIIFQEMKPTW